MTGGGSPNRLKKKEWDLLALITKMTESGPAGSRLLGLVCWGISQPSLGFTFPNGSSQAVARCSPTPGLCPISAVTWHRERPRDPATSTLQFND